MRVYAHAVDIYFERKFSKQVRKFVSNKVFDFEYNSSQAKVRTMAKETGNYQIPFDKDGNLQHYPTDYPHFPTTWKNNEEFEDTLTYLTYSRGRSAAILEFAKSDGKKVHMFMKDFDQVVPYMSHGKITGKFTFCKRGMNYGLRMIL